jgi:DNA-binding NarL/FixJ family response regulator
VRNPLRIVLIDDHPLFREGVAYILGNEPDLAVVGQGATAAEAASLAREHRPDLVLLDLDMPGGGLNAITAIASASPATRIAILTAATAEEPMLTALRAGARGYILKGVAARELIGIVRTIAIGEGYVSPVLAAAFLSEITRGGVGPHADVNSTDELTEREHQVLELVATGASNKEIAHKLNLTEKTVKYYMTNILQKLNVRNRVEAALLSRNSTGTSRRA